MGPCWGGGGRLRGGEEDFEVALLGLLLVGCGETVGAAEDRGRLSLAFSLHSPPSAPPARGT